MSSEVALGSSSGRPLADAAKVSSVGRVLLRCECEPFVKKAIDSQRESCSQAAAADKSELDQARPDKQERAQRIVDQSLPDDQQEISSVSGRSVLSALLVVVPLHRCLLIVKITAYSLRPVAQKHHRCASVGWVRQHLLGV